MFAIFSKDEDDCCSFSPVFVSQDTLECLYDFFTLEAFLFIVKEHLDIFFFT